MRCFLTGVTGFIGSATAKRLIAKGHEVSGLTSSAGKADELAATGIHPVVGDLRRPQEWLGAVRDAEVVVHLATFPIPRRPGARYMRSLVQAQESAVAAMLDAVSPRCKAFVYTSGMTVYGAGATKRSESGELRPYRIARAYAAGERLVLAANEARGVPGIVLRPAGVYGMGGIFGRFWAGPIAAGRRAGFPGDGARMFSFVHVDDCAEAYVRCVEDPVPGQVFNIADDEPVAIGDLIRALAGAMGAPRPFGIPAPVFRLVAGPLVAEMLLNDNVVSNRKMVERLGVTLSYPTYREGVAALAATARTHA
jgi:2-alkyl-3-oxoalkanoate reductase